MGKNSKCHRSDSAEWKRYESSNLDDAVRGRKEKWNGLIVLRNKIFFFMVAQTWSGINWMKNLPKLHEMLK